MDCKATRRTSQKDSGREPVKLIKIVANEIVRRLELRFGSGKAVQCPKRRHHFRFFAVCIKLAWCYFFIFNPQPIYGSSVARCEIMPYGHSLDENIRFAVLIKRRYSTP